MRFYVTVLLACFAGFFAPSAAWTQEAEGELEDLRALMTTPAPAMFPTEQAGEIKLNDALPTPAALPTRNVNDPFEMVRWELQLASSGYELHPSAPNRNRYLIALEKAVSVFCMESLRSSTDYTKPPSSTECSENLDKLIALDDANPIGVCARDGIDSATCTNVAQDAAVFVYHTQTVSLGFGAAQPERADLELAFKLDAERTDLNKMKYYQVLTDIESKMNQSKDADELLRLKKQERAGFATLLRETCKSTRIVLEANSLVSGLRAQFTPASQLNAKKELQRMETEKLMKEISKMMQNGATPTPTAAPNPALDFTRVRYISANCNASIGYARTRRPDYSGADCYYYGFYTPQCTGARRKEIKLMLSAPPRAGASAPAVEVQQGLEEF